MRTDRLASASGRLLNLVRAGALRPGDVRVTSFALADAKRSIEAAAGNRGLECTVVAMVEK